MSGSMDMQEVMSRVATVQAALSITDPITASIKRAYPYFPKSSKAISDTPCFINTWTLRSLQFKSVLLVADISVHMQLLVQDADTDRAADIATAFYQKIVAGFAAKIKLNAFAPAVVTALRGGEPTLTVLEYADIPFVGLDLFLDINLNAAATFTP